MSIIFKKSSFYGDDVYDFVCYSYGDDGKKLIYTWSVTREERDRFLKEKTFPITDCGNYFIYLNEDGFFHNTKGKAFCQKTNADIGDYHINGYIFNSKEEWIKAILKRIYFLRKKIICLQKLLEIPEQFDEVYYTHKNTFLSLMKKV